MLTLCSNEWYSFHGWRAPESYRNLLKLLVLHTGCVLQTYPAFPRVDRARVDRAVKSRPKFVYGRIKVSAMIRTR